MQSLSRSFQGLNKNLGGPSGGGIIALLGLLATALLILTEREKEHAAKLDAIPDRTRAVQQAHQELLQAQGRTTEARIRQIKLEASEMAKETGNAVLAERVKNAKLAALDKELAEKRAEHERRRQEAVRAATVAILEAEGRTHAARLVQIESERQKVAQETGDEALAGQVAAARRLEIEREFAQRRAALFEMSTQELLRARGDELGAELAALRAHLEERKHEIEESLRAEVISVKDAARLKAEAEAAYEAERQRRARQLAQERDAFLFSEAQKTLQVAKANLEEQLLASEATRREEIAGIEDQYRRRRVTAEQAQLLIQYAEQRAATRTVQIFADAIKQKKDLIASLQAAYEQTMENILRLDLKLIQLRGQAAGKNPQQIQDEELQRLQAAAAGGNLGAATQVKDIFAERLAAAREALAAARAAFAGTPTTENAQAEYQARQKVVDAQIAFNAALQREIELTQKAKDGATTLAGEQDRARQKAAADLDKFQKDYGGALARLASGAAGAGDELYKILGQQVPQKIVAAWHDAVEKIAADFRALGVPLPGKGTTPAPTVRGSGSLVPSTAGGTVNNYTINGLAFNIPPQAMRSPEDLGRFIIETVREYWAAQQRRQP